MNKEKFEQTLSELEKTQKDFWNVSRSTGNFLNMLVKMNNSKGIYNSSA